MIRNLVCLVTTFPAMSEHLYLSLGGFSGANFGNRDLAKAEAPGNKPLYAIWALVSLPLARGLRFHGACLGSMVLPRAHKKAEPTKVKSDTVFHGMQVVLQRFLKKEKCVSRHKLFFMDWNGAFPPLVSKQCTVVVMNVLSQRQGRGKKLQRGLLK